MIHNLFLEILYPIYNNKYITKEITLNSSIKLAISVISAIKLCAHTSIILVLLKCANLTLGVVSLG